MQMIYLAGPYSSPEREIRQQRAKAYREALAFFANTASGLCLYSPIVHWSTVADEHDLPHDFHFWIQQDFHMIRKSNAMWVLPLDGWLESYGLSQELEYAELINKPVLFVLRDESGFRVTPDRPNPGPTPSDLR